MDFVTGRSGSQVVAAVVGTWLAFCLAMYLALPQPPDPLHLALGSLAGGVLILAGFSATSRCRPLPFRAGAKRFRLALLSLVSGSALGAVLLYVLIALAQSEPLLRARFAGRLAEPAWRPWVLGLESSILEEVVFRLFAMSVIALLALRLFRHQGMAFAVALIGSALLFGLIHLPAWSSAGPMTASVIAAVLLLNLAAGLLFGWTFWRWGLPYAILCHLTGDVVMQTFAPRLLA